MIRASYLRGLLVFVGFLCPLVAVAQYDGGVSLGDFARSLRNGQPSASPVVIDNDNLSQVMDEVENHRLTGTLFSMEGASDRFKMSSPDGTCSLSFNANATSLLTVPYVAEDLPQNELAKLDGPATIDGDTLQVTVYNGSVWNVKEITVGVTLVRHDDQRAAYGAARLLPAVEESPVPAEKQPDLTRLVRLKGTAAPLATTIFRAKMEGIVNSDQEWHWAIVQAKGIPPSPLAVPNY